MSGQKAAAASADDWVDSLFCGCGHKAIDHHGTDARDGCLGIVSHKLPQCPCHYTCTEAKNNHD